MSMMSREQSSRSLGRSYSRSGSGIGSISSENLPPRTLARVAREVRDLHTNPPEGVRLVVDSDTGVPSNLGEVMAEIEGPTGTPYEARHFQLKLVLSSDFPASPPRGFFLTKIYHPNVDMSTGAICVNTLKKDWTSSTTFSHVLSVVRCLLIVPFPESSLNDEAGKLFMDSYEEFARRAKLMADVHGRKVPCNGGGNAVINGSMSSRGKAINGGNLEEDTEGPARGKLSRSSSCTSSFGSCPARSLSSNSSLRSNSSTLSRSSSHGNNIGNQRSSAKGDKKSKKRGLKRL